MNDALQRLSGDYLDGNLDAGGQSELEALVKIDPTAFTEQLQIHHSLIQALGEAPSLAPAVVRGLRFEQDAPRFTQDVVARIKGGQRVARFASLAAAACVLAITGWFVMGPAAARPDVLLVVGGLSLKPGDVAARDRLRKLGFSVEIKDSAYARTSDAVGRRLVALSSTAIAEEFSDVPEEVKTRFRGVAVPVLVWEPRLFQGLGLTGGGIHGVDWAASPERQRLSILDPAHPLAAGLSGTVEVTLKPERLSWGRVGPSAQRIAVLEGEPEKTALFGFERGALLEGAFPAPSRRVGLFLFDTTAAGLSESGGRLFDAAVRWCLDRETP